MNTVTHVLVNAAIDRRVRERRAAGEDVSRRENEPPRSPDPESHPIATKAFLWGGVAPDLPLITMTIVAAGWFMATRGWSLGDSLGHVFRDLYFSNLAWKAVNNLLQSPVMLVIWVGVALLVRRRWPQLGRTFLWFLAGATVHVALDIPVHHDDGPLLLFPVEWSVRFNSPVSYWDPDHFGDVVGTIEYVTMAGLGLYLLRYRIALWWWRLRRARFG